MGRGSSSARTIEPGGPGKAGISTRAGDPGGGSGPETSRGGAGCRIPAGTGPDKTGRAIRNSCPGPLLLSIRHDGEREYCGIPIASPEESLAYGKYPGSAGVSAGRERVAAAICGMLSRDAPGNGICFSRGRSRGLTELSADLIFVIAGDGTVTYANPAARRTLGFGRQTGRLEDLFPREFGAALAPVLSGVLESGNTARRQYDIPWGAGVRTFDTILEPVTGAGGSVRRVMGTARDITDRVAREEESRVLAISQMESNIEQFMILNDRIRNPLQVIRSLVELDPHLYQETIQEQISLIDELVSELDRGWLRSQKVRQYLIDRHRHEPSDDPGVVFAAETSAEGGRRSA